LLRVPFFRHNTLHEDDRTRRFGLKRAAGMALTPKEAASDAAVAVLRPLVELMLDAGITSPEFESLSRSVFTHAAHDRLVASNEDASYARVSLMTGLHRNEVSAQLKRPPQIAPDREARTYGANRVLSGWHTDDRYLNERGHPRLLQMTGRGGFDELVESYAPNISAAIVLEELMRAGAAETLSTGEVRARSDSLGSQGLDIAGIEAMGSDSSHYLQTLRHNVRHPSDGWMAETIMSDDVDRDALPFLRHTLRTGSRAYVSKTASEISDPRLRRSADSKDGRVRVGVSIFYFEEPIESAKGETSADMPGPARTERVRNSVQAKTVRRSAQS
jgi:hypothetical protein